MEALMRITHDADTKKSSAFTLLEVMIAIGILAVGLLGIAAMSLHAMSQGRAGKHATEAATIAYSVLEEFHRMNFADPNLNAAAWNALQPITTPGLFPGSNAAMPPPTQGSVQIQGLVQQSQVYTVQWQIIDAPVPPAPPWPPGTIAVRKFIDVRVVWTEPDWPNRQVTISGVRYDDQPTDI
jgi:prepilin-type N-terminal cleavage/methylation domain-containing protein